MLGFCGEYVVAHATPADGVGHGLVVPGREPQGRCERVGAWWVRLQEREQFHMSGKGSAAGQRRAGANNIGCRPGDAPCSVPSTKRCGSDKSRVGGSHLCDSGMGSLNKLLQLHRRLCVAHPTWSSASNNRIVVRRRAVAELTSNHTPVRLPELQTTKQAKQLLVTHLDCFTWQSATGW